MGIFAAGEVGEDSGSLPSWAFLLLQDRLSTKCSFLICSGDDVNEEGYIISNASPGFVDLFGYPASECVGMRCRPFRCCSPPSCSTIAEAEDVSIQTVQDSSQFMDEYVKAQIRVAMGTDEQPGSNVGYTARRMVLPWCAN